MDNEQDKCQMCNKDLDRDTFNRNFCSETCFNEWYEAVYEWHVLHEDFQ